MRQLLVVVAPNGGIRKFTIPPGGEVVIGRDPSATVVLESAQVSRRHARVYQQDYDILVEDLGSSNGIQIDNQRITGPTRLVAGKTFVIGGYRLNIAMEDDPPRYALGGRSEPCTGKTFGLPEGSLEVGRGNSVDIAIEHSSISRHHAIVRVKGTNVSVEDAGSSNGTWVNGQRTVHSSLALGDEVRFGSVAFVLENYRDNDDRHVRGSKRSWLPIAAPVVLAVALAVGGALWWKQHTRHREEAPASALATAPGAGPATAPGAGTAAKRPAEAPPPVQDTNQPPDAEQEAPPGSAAPAPTHPAGKHHRDSTSWQAPQWWVHWRNKPGALGKEEIAYEQGITEALTTAQNQAQGLAWSLAAATYARVLKVDPLNEAAIAGQQQADEALESQQVLAEAQQALAQGQPGRAFSRVSTLMAQGIEDPALTGVADKARLSLAQKCAGEANAACASKAWPKCQTQAVCALAYQPRDASGWALLEEAENGMRTHNVVFTPYSGATTNRAALSQMYPDDRVRDAILRYASGDVDAAIKRLRPTARRGRQPLNLMLTVQRAQDSGDAAANGNDITKAVAAWSDGLSADKQLLPPGQPSVVGSGLHRKVGKELLQQGEGAFNRGIYGDAFKAWQQGLLLEPDNQDLSEAMDRLESRAARLLEAVDRRAPLDVAACGRLREVIEMTRPENLTHKDAAERMAKCGAATGDGNVVAPAARP